MQNGTRTKRWHSVVWRRDWKLGGALGSTYSHLNQAVIWSVFCSLKIMPQTGQRMRKRSPGLAELEAGKPKVKGAATGRGLPAASGQHRRVSEPVPDGAKKVTPTLHPCFQEPSP